MASRPTLHDVAREAGVSIATVDRVLNGRAKVREETARKVYEAAHRIEYHAASVIKQRIQAELPEVHFGFVLQKERQYFYQKFAEEIREAVRLAPNIRGHAHIVFPQSQSPDDIASHIEGMGGRVQAIAAVALNHHRTSSAVQELKNKGIPTFSLLSDFAQGIRESYVGLNNLKIGRICA